MWSHIIGSFYSHTQAHTRCRRIYASLSHTHAHARTLYTDGCKATATTAQSGDAAMLDTMTVPWCTRYSRCFDCAGVDLMARAAAVSTC